MTHGLTHPVGIIGVGNRGGAMASNLLAHGLAREDNASLIKLMRHDN